MDYNVLKNLGMNDKEVKVYITCLSLRQAAVSTIAKRCDIKRTSTYAIVSKLIEKGFITVASKNNINYYAALSPEFLIENYKFTIREAQKNLQELEKNMPALEALKEKNVPIKAKFFEGIENVAHSYIEFIQAVPSDATIYNYVFPASIDYKEFRKAMSQFIQVRQSKNIHCKTISSLCEDAVKLKVTDTLDNRETLISFIQESGKISSEMLICNNIILDMSYSKKEIFSSLTINKDIAALRIAVFNMAWQQAKIDDKKICKQEEIQQLMKKFKHIQAY